MSRTRLRLAVALGIDYIRSFGGQRNALLGVLFGDHFDDLGKLSKRVLATGHDGIAGGNCGDPGNLCTVFLTIETRLIIYLRASFQS